MPATMWTLVLSARDLESPDSQAALAKLCEIYWYPLYWFIRCKGNDHHRAQDLAQGFFEHLLSRQWLQGVGREKGRFRTFLLCALSNFLVNEHASRGALKRGGAVVQFVSWEEGVAKSRYEGQAAAGPDLNLEFEIGRASCRERVWIGGGAGAAEEGKL